MRLHSKTYKMSIKLKLLFKQNYSNPSALLASNDLMVQCFPEINLLF